MTSETKGDKDVALIIDIPSESETSLLCKEIYENVWIADSGSHMTNTLQGMYHQHRISSKVKIGSGKYMDANIFVMCQAHALC